MKLEDFTLKGSLAFFLVIVSAGMVILWMLHPPSADANALALLAGFVTLFIKMAADAVGYQYGSSSGSDKKDETQAKVAATLAASVAPTPPTPPPSPTIITAWWSLLTDPEKSAIAEAANADPRLKAFSDAAALGKAAMDDLNYLVSKGLLTQERADIIKAA